MGKLAHRAAALAAAVLMIAAATAATAQEGAGRHVTVTGTGRVSVAPDMAHVNVGVTEQAEEAGAALEAMSVALDAVIERLKAAGVAESDLQTGQLNLSPRYANSSLANGEGRIVGFTASSIVEVRVRELDGLGAVISAVVGEGANELNGIRFDVADRSPLIAKARRAAVTDALERAELYADAAGLALGDVQSITEGGGDFPQPMAEARFAMSDQSVPIAAGEIEVTADVRVVVTLSDGE